jgi:hypothetical protein
VCGGGATKTQIVYKSGLNFHTIIPYLDLLTRSGLVVRTEGTIRDDRQGRSGAHTPAGDREAGVGRKLAKKKKADLAVIEQDALVQGPPPRRELNREDIQNT